MNQGFSHVRVPARFVALLALSALLLASCAQTAVVPPARLRGTPAISFSVPLSEVACTLNDVCVATGAASNGLGPTSVAEFSSPKGNWFNLTLPSGAPTLLTSVACAGDQCLLGGSRPGQDLLMSFATHGDALSTLVAPTGGIGVSALACNAGECGLIDTGTTGEPRFSLSTDEGSTWTTPVALAWAKGDAITAFSCASVDDCAVGVLTVGHQFALYLTTDEGATWTEATTPAAWTTLTSLSCLGKRCEGLASTGTSSLLVRSKTFTRTWSSTKLARAASALACFTFNRCVVVGEGSSDKPWLATIRDADATNVDLRYVPSPLLDVACGTKVCAAIGVTTLLSVPATT